MSIEAFHKYFMNLAIGEARVAAAENEVPTGAVIIEKPADFNVTPESVRILSKAHNITEQSHNATSHAEILAITKASEERGDFRLTDTILYVTKEPCAMCAGAIVLARIPIVVWGLSDPKRGGESVFGILSSDALIHKAQITAGICEEETGKIIRDFFKAKR